MGPFRLIAAAGALGIAAATPALGAWSGPERVSAGPGDAHSPDLATNGGGGAVAAWVETAGRRGRIVASVRSAGGAWSRPAVVSPPGGSAIDPRAGIDAGGGAVLAWRQVVRTRVLQGRRQAVYVARARARRAGGGWGAVATLSDGRQKVGPVELAVDPRGVAVAAWHWGTGTRSGTPGHVGEVQIAERRAGGPWGRARRALTPRGCGLDTRLPDVAAGSGGHAVVWWQCDRPDGRSGAKAIGRGPSPGAWSAEVGLPFAAPGDQAADLAVEPGGAPLGLSAGAGRILTLWRGGAPLGTRRGLELAPVALAPRRQVARSGGRPSASAAAAGATGGWIGPDGLGLADIGPPATAARATVLGGPPGAARDARVAATPAGAAVAVALSAAGTVVATARATGGDWSPLEPISAAGAAGADVGATDGIATAYWSRRAGGRSVVERAELRPAP